VGDQSKKNQVGRACSTYEGEERHIKVLVVKTKGRRRLVKPRHRWEYNIKMILQEYDGGHGLD
jgi:hypothetical protein